jgi:ribosomal protein L35AE/L33A
MVRKNDADRDLAVIGTVGRVEGAAAVVKANFAANMGAESLSQSGCIFER